MASIKKPMVWTTGVLAATGTAATAQDVGLDGLYFGLSLGKYQAEDNVFDYAVVAADESLAGAFIGYDRDFGSFFVGGELAATVGLLNWNALSAPNDYSASVLDAKLRVGTAFSGAKVYGFVGGSKMFNDSNFLDDESTGTNYGIGASYGVTDNLDVGLEYITRDFGDAGDSYTETSALSTVSLRVGFSF